MADLFWGGCSFYMSVWIKLFGAHFETDDYCAHGEHGAYAGGD